MHIVYIYIYIYMYIYIYIYIYGHRTLRRAPPLSICVGIRVGDPSKLDGFCKIFWVPNGIWTKVLEAPLLMSYGYKKSFDHRTQCLKYINILYLLIRNIYRIYICHILCQWFDYERSILMNSCRLRSWSCKRALSLSQAFPLSVSYNVGQWQATAQHVTRRSSNGTTRHSEKYIIYLYGNI